MESSKKKSDILIPPLRKIYVKTGKPYNRYRSNEAVLHQILALPRKEMVLRCENEDEKDPDFVPSECLVHLVRSFRNEPANPHFERIYSALMKRIFQRLPRAESPDKKKLYLKESRIQEGVIDGFQELLAMDRTSYEELLDYWEVAFGSALKRLKLTIQDKVWRETNQSVSLENQETGEVRTEVSEAVETSDPFDPEELLKKDYREQLYAAIDRLTPEHRRIVKMYLEGFPANSSDPNAMSIAKVLKVSDKTARTRRQEAIAALKRAIARGDER